MDTGSNPVEAVDRHFKSPVLKNLWEVTVSVIYKILPTSETKATVQSLALSMKKINVEAVSNYV